MNYYMVKAIIISKLVMGYKGVIFFKKIFKLYRKHGRNTEEKEY